MAATALIIGEAMVELRPASELGTDVGAHLAWTFAGDTLNCAAALSATAPAVDTTYLTGIGDDPLSARFRAFCQGLDVATDHAIVVPGRQLGLYWVETDGDERWFRYWRGESAARAALGDGLELPTVRAGDVVVLSAITAAVAGGGWHPLAAQLAHARACGARIAYDGNHRPALWTDDASARACAETALRTADVVVSSVDDIELVWNESAEDFLDRCERWGVQEAIVTDGPRPLLLRADGSTTRIAPPAVDAVDPTGAGDSFFGTYLGARITGEGPGVAATRAVAAAAVAVQHVGALAHLHEHPPRDS